MDQASSINWEPILWAAGTGVTLFLAIITGLLTWIAKLIQSDREEMSFRLDSHDKKFKKQQKEIHELRVDTRETLAIIKTKLRIP